MRTHALSKWLLVGAAMVMGAACQSKKTSSAASDATPSSVRTPPDQLRCEPDANTGCEQKCREDECDEEEAGEEAMIHVIEVGDAEDESTASSKEIAPVSLETTAEAAAQSSPKPAVVEVPTDMAKEAQEIVDTSEAPVVEEAAQSSPKPAVVEVPTDMAKEAQEVVDISEAPVVEAAAQSSPQPAVIDAPALDMVEAHDVIDAFEEPVTIQSDPIAESNEETAVHH